MKDSEVRSKIQVLIAVIVFMILLWATAFINNRQSETIIRDHIAPIVPISNSGEEMYIKIQLDNEVRRFTPNRHIWKALQAQDSVAVSIKKGAFGFSFIDTFSPRKE